MYTENQIKSLPLEEQQKIVIDLKQVPQSDKYYETAQRLIKFITGLKTYKAPQEIEVKNIAGHVVTVDNKIIEPEQTAKIHPWQLNALRRFLEPVAAAAMLLFVLLFVLSASATTTNFLGSPGSYNVSYIAGLNGGTNSVWTNTTVSYTALTTNTTSIVTNSNWTVVNGQATNQTTTTTNVTVSVPGLFTIPPNAPFSLIMAGNLWVGNGTAGTSVGKFSYSADGSYWQSNYWVLPLTPIGGAGEITSTNVQVPAMSGGYGRLDTISGLGTAGISNLAVEVAKPQ